MHWKLCSQCELWLWLGAFKVVFPAENLFNNVKQLGAGPARLWFGSVNTKLPRDTLGELLALEPRGAP